MEERRIRLAILDMYDGTPNQGMRAIHELVERFSDQLEWQTFDVRGKAEVPDTGFDIYISSGGPGDPLEGDGVWDTKFFNLLDRLWAINRSGEGPKKFVFFICHSFQMACHHFGLAEIKPRKSRSFGTFPVHKTEEGLSDPYFENLPNPFCVADFRNYQVVQPKQEVLASLGAKVLALEKIRPHVPLERAMMAVRFSREFFGTQFHPEADPEGMILHFEKQEMKELVAKNHGMAKFYQMIKDLNDPDMIELTHNTLIPAFLQDAIHELSLQTIS
ncbi:MAG: GMP synthase [Bacteroidota bacterium]